MSLISVKEATQVVLERTEDFGGEFVNFINATNRVLDEDITADRDFPPFDRVCMDGIAIDITSFANGIVTYKIEDIQRAGAPQLTLKDNTNCLEVMTGAILPKNTNAVIPYELINIKDGEAHVNVPEVRDFQNIHPKGKDRKQGETILKKHTLLTSAETGVLATVGKKEVKVKKQPNVVIISTGDELVEVDQEPLMHQIRRSNVYSLVTLLEKLAIPSQTYHIADDKKALKDTIADIMEAADVILFSGAVSKGKYDFIPEVLDELGVEKLFHRVKQRPGKPFWFGKKDKKTIFAFPGNPVSTFVSCLRYFYPWYRKSMGLDHKNTNWAILDQDYTFKPDLTYFLQVQLTNRDGKIYATPITGNGSGDLANLVDVNAFLELPGGKDIFLKGEVFNYIAFR